MVVATVFVYFSMGLFRRTTTWLMGFFTITAAAVMTTVILNAQVLVIAAAAVPFRTEERQALVQFYYRTGGPFWKNNENWLAVGVDHCEWFGVSCGGGESERQRVQSLVLPDNHLTMGRLHSLPELCAGLPDLTLVDWSRNSLSALRLSWDYYDNNKMIRPVAANLYSLNLGYADLQGNLGGAGDSSVGWTTALAAWAPKLQFLNLSGNRLASATPLPPLLLQLPLLERLDLSHNHFSGELGSLSSHSSYFLVHDNLRELRLSSNAFSGTLPSAGRLWRSLPQLRVLDLAKNEFSGTLPFDDHDNDDLLPLLEVLDIRQIHSENSLVGSLPSFGNHRHLYYIDLSGNALSGPLPEALLATTDIAGDLSLLVLLADNEFTGKIPAVWGRRFDRLFLDITGNRITEIARVLCLQTEWMEGLVGAATYDPQMNPCHVLACPPGTSNLFGRQTSATSSCEPCSSGHTHVPPFYGSKTCGLANWNVKDHHHQPIPESVDPVRAILQELFHATHGTDSWTEASGWLGEPGASTNYCTWFGVSCNAGGSVVGLSLDENGLVGTVPSTLLSLSSLKELDLSHNDLTFDFYQVGSFSTSVLSVLKLSGMHLSNVDGIASSPAFTGLQELHLTDNDLGGTFPTELLQLPRLEQLFLNYNALTGRLPANLSQLRRLEHLYLFHNRLTGQLPADLGRLANLKVLVLSENNFDGTLPPELNDLSQLEILAIQREGGTRVDQSYSGDPGSGLTGPLLALDRLPNLRQLYLGVNSLTGSIPNNFLNGLVDVSAPIEVDLIENLLTGLVPSALARLEQMALYVAGNRLSGVSEALCDQPGWMHGEAADYQCLAIACPPGSFSFYGRQVDSDSVCKACPDGAVAPYYGSFECVHMSNISAKEHSKSILKAFYQATNGNDWKRRDNWMDDNVDICEWFGITCKDELEIESIMLGSNNLVGTPPAELFELPGLAVLWLYSNPIEFSFEGIGMATSLTSLQLDSTGLRSLSGIGRARSLVDVYVRFNQLSGTLPVSELAKLPSLETFLCNDNRLSGDLPSFEANKRLYAISAGNNQFSGQLPSFSDHPRLKIIEVSDNQLTGPIPEDFLASGDSSRRLFLDLSSNQLTGVVPASLARFTDVTIYLRNNLFEGIHPNVCKQPSWNGGDVDAYGCDGIICPAKSYSAIGRASKSGTPCLRCSKSKYFGTAPECAVHPTVSFASCLSLKALLVMTFGLSLGHLLLC